MSETEDPIDTGYTSQIGHTWNRSKHLSFVIPARNEGGYIGDSLLNLATLRSRYDLDFDIIVVDGGSSDDTVLNCHLADKLIQDSVLARRSIAHGRNIGSQHSQAELLFHTDADVIVPDLQLLLPELQRVFSLPNVVAATTRILPYPWDCKPIDRLMHSLINRIIQLAIPLGALLGRGECQIVRRSVFEQVGGYNGRIIVGEDCDLFHRLSRHGRIIYMSDFCVYHSSRRFRSYGYLKTFLIYLREAIWLMLRRKSFLSEWEVVR